MGSRRHFRRTGAVALVALLACLVGIDQPEAQETALPYGLAPDARLPRVSPERLRVVPPEPRVRVSGQQERDPRQMRDLIRGGATIDEGRSSQRPSRSAQSTRDRSSRNRTVPTPSRTSPSRSSRRSTASDPGSDGPRGGTGPRRAPGRDAETDGPVEYGRLIVITGFSGVNVTIDGQPYPFESMQGVLLYAGEQYEVVLEQAETDAPSSRSGSTGVQSRAIPVRVAAGETRVLMANLGGDTAERPPSRGRSRTPSRRRASRDDDDDEEIGYLGVSSSPRGIVYVDGENTGQMTPARRIELDPGRHEVRIFYESEDRFSETKNVLIRQGVNTNVFFRLRRDELEDDSED